MFVNGPSSSVTAYLSSSAQRFALSRAPIRHVAIDSGRDGSSAMLGGLHWSASTAELQGVAEHLPEIQ
jgi:hypothetical protein